MLCTSYRIHRLLYYNTRLFSVECINMIVHPLTSSVPLHSIRWCQLSSSSSSSCRFSSPTSNSLPIHQVSLLKPPLPQPYPRDPFLLSPVIDRQLIVLRNPPLVRCQNLRLRIYKRTRLMRVVILIEVRIMYSWLCNRFSRYRVRSQLIRRASFFRRTGKGAPRR